MLLNCALKLVEEIIIEKRDLICTSNRLILKNNWDIYRCLVYCRFCGKWMRGYILSEQSVDFNC